MIRYIKRSDLDEVKYNACIKNALNSRIYAYSWYLDLVATNWDVLILNDYKAVMPLPWRSKYLIKYVYPPAWTQQLGVFSSIMIEEFLIHKFIKNIPKKFIKLTIQFNSANALKGKHVVERVNYIFTLNQPYNQLLNAFSKSRKRVLKNITHKNFVIEKNVNYRDFLNFYSTTHKNYQLLPKQFSSLEKLLSSRNQSVNIWGVCIDGKLVSGLVWLKDECRITFLLPISTAKAKDLGIPTLMVAALIKQFSNTNLSLDFEGSMIDGVARFYKSFGSEKESYYLFSKPSFL